MDFPDGDKEGDMENIIEEENKMDQSISMQMSNRDQLMRRGSGLHKTPGWEDNVLNPDSSRHDSRA